MNICEVCDQPIELNQSFVHKVIGWVVIKNGRPTGNVIKPSGALGYAHKVCLETGRAESREQTLF